MKLRYQNRIYPTNQQKTRLSQLFGCVRFVFNDTLAYCQEKHKNDEKKPNNTELSKRLTQLKRTKEKEWLNDVSAIPLQQSLRDLDQAYSNFFKSCKGERKGRKVKLPSFKKRNSRQSARFTDNGFKIGQHNVYLPKIGKLKIAWSRKLPSSPSSVTVIRDSVDRYFLSFVVEINPWKETRQSRTVLFGWFIHTTVGLLFRRLSYFVRVLCIPAQLPDNGQSVGIDLGITDFATFSSGEKVKSPKPLKKCLKRLRRLQRNLSKKQKSSKRREVARKRIAKLHAKIKDTRTDFLHKLTTKIIRENQTIVLEDLAVSNLVKNRKLSRAISDLGWRSFRTMLEAKSIMYGRHFKVISRWEPTSQKCSSCGEIGGKKALNIREWSCLFCGTEHDRDINAALNILVAGGQSETLNGRGGRRKTAIKVAASNEASTTFKPVQLSLF